jgi:serine protease
MKMSLRLWALVVVVFVIAWIIYSHRWHRFSWAVDPAVKSFGPAAPAVAGAVPAEYVLGPNGVTYKFAGDRVVVRPKDAADLSRILATYKGTVLYDGSAKPSKSGKPVAPSGTWLIRVDASSVATDDLVSSLKKSKLYGRYTFSSMNGVRMVALAAREIATGASVGLDPSLHPGEVWNTTQVMEGADPDSNTGGQLNYANEWYATATLNLSNKQLGIGLVRAWDYLEYKGIPFGSTWTVPTLVIIDGGFAVDTHTGAPLNGNLDFHMNTTPVQWSETTGGNRNNAGGSNPSSCDDSCPWHGTEVYSAAAASPFNNFGSAGSGGEIPSTAIVKIDDTDGFEVAMAIWDAARLEPAPAVMNISSYSGPCGVDPQFCGYFYANTFDSIGDAVTFARAYSNTTVVSIAGNDSDYNNKKYDDVPCTLPGVLCVGAIYKDATLETYTSGLSGYGPRVAIFAPDGEWTTLLPGKSQIQRSWGTSISAPFVCGIITLMKALNPSLTPDQVLSILQATVLKSPDSHVKPGYVNALAAVQAVSPNLPPTIKITEPPPNSTFLYNTYITFGSHVSDPEQPGGVAGLQVVWSSNVDGLLCTGIVCDFPRLTIGQHTITATITDPFGAKASASMPLKVTKPPPPTAYIVLPGNNATFSASQQIHLVGAGSGLSQPPLPSYELAWSGNTAGALGTGSDIWVTLPAGAQTITLTATDDFHQTGTAEVSITLQSGTVLPTVKILSPAYLSELATGQPETFQGEASEPPNGALSGASLQWTDNIDGYLGQGATITKVLSSFSCGPTGHKVTLTATDSHGNQSSTTVEVDVGPIC